MQQETINIHIANKILRENADNTWKQSINNKPKLRSYATIKENLNVEN